MSAVIAMPLPEYCGHEAGGDAEKLRARVAELEHELFLVKVRAGELDPPVEIESARDAELWLAWAGVNCHQAGCLCRRCPVARRLSGANNNRRS